MFEEIHIQNYTAEQICDLLLEDDDQITAILATAVKQLMQEMAGVNTVPSAAEVFRQLDKAA